MQLLVIRHAQPEDQSGTDGDGDPPLSELGQRQARAIAAYMRTEHIDHIVSSPMQRARQTGEPLAAALGHEIEFDDDLKEAGWQLTYTRSEENMGAFVENLAEDPEYFYRPEGKAVFTKRVVGSFSRIASENPGRNVAVFCHGMVTRVLATHALGSDPAVRQMHPDYSSLTRVLASPSRDLWSLKSFNETMHLYEVGIT